MSRDKVLGGLTPQEVSESRAKHGENVLTPPQKVSIIKLYLEKFQDPIIQVFTHRSRCFFRPCVRRKQLY